MIYNTIEVETELIDSVVEVEADLIQDVQVTHHNTDDYERLNNLPQLNGVEIRGVHDLERYGYSIMTNSDIDDILNKFV